MLSEFKVSITETVTRDVWVRAENPADAIRVAEENYNHSEVAGVEFDVDPLSRRPLPADSQRRSWYVPSAE